MKFRKKPVVIEAMELTRENYAEVQAWCGGKTWSRPPMRAVTGLSIETLEGTMDAAFGDWIIKGVKGEFYPCKPDIFAATYEPVEGGTALACNYPFGGRVLPHIACGLPPGQPADSHCPCDCHTIYNYCPIAPQE